MMNQSWLSLAVCYKRVLLQIVSVVYILWLKDCRQSIEAAVCNFVGPGVAPVNDPV